MVNKGPELLKCAEDDDFLAEFDKMITEVGYYDNLFFKMVIIKLSTQHKYSLICSYIYILLYYIVYIIYIIIIV